jgi:hypothetical protein
MEPEENEFDCKDNLCLVVKEKEGNVFIKGGVMESIKENVKEYTQNCEEFKVVVEENNLIPKNSFMVESSVYVLLLESCEEVKRSNQKVEQWLGRK